jgi:CTP synthase
LEDNGTIDVLQGVNGVLVPGGFGNRGAEGKMMSAKWAREENIPYLGVCFGFQLATIEFARNVLGLKGANSAELDPKSPHPVVNILPEQKGVDDMGATMRLGDHEIKISKGKASELYGKNRISERHRHRYEINPEYIDQIESKGLKYTGRDLSGRRMEILELEGHPYFLASQFHPEFKSRPDEPSPLHLGLVKAALAHKKG